MRILQATAAASYFLYSFCVYSTTSAIWGEKKLLKKILKLEKKKPFMLHAKIELVFHSQEIFMTARTSFSRL